MSNREPDGGLHTDRWEWVPVELMLSVGATGSGAGWSIFHSSEGKLCSYGPSLQHSLPLWLHPKKENKWSEPSFVRKAEIKDGGTFNHHLTREACMILHIKLVYLDIRRLWKQLFNVGCVSRRFLKSENNPGGVVRRSFLIMSGLVSWQRLEGHKYTSTSTLTTKLGCVSSD